MTYEEAKEMGINRKIFGRKQKMQNNEEKTIVMFKISKETEKKLKIYAVMKDITTEDAVDKILKEYLGIFIGVALNEKI